MDWTSAVVTTASSDTEPSIVVTFGSAKYIFNAGENTTRAWLESRRNWRKSRCIFLTSVSVQRGSGLPGLLMSLADASIAKLTLTGPTGMLHFLAQMRAYVWREQLEVDPVEVNVSALLAAATPQPVYKDENITLYGIPVVPEPFTSAHDSVSGVSGTLLNDNNKRKRSPSPDSSSKRSAVEVVSNPDTRPLESRMHSSDFDPRSLVGEEAQRWRELNIYKMFSPPKPAKKGQGMSGPSQPEPSAASSPKVDSSPVDSEQPRSHSLPHKLAQLPMFQHLPGQEKSTLCYVCVGPRQRGKFDAKKAEEMGIPRGRERANLAKGQTVVCKVNDPELGIIERTIRPEELIGPSETPRVIMIFDVPTQEHILPLASAFEQSAFYKKFLASGHGEDYIVHSVYHLCGPSVLEDARYKALLAKFHPDVNHVVASREHIPDLVTFTSAGFHQLRLNQLDPDMFPIHRHNLTPAKPLSEVPGLPKNIFPMAVNLVSSLRPHAPPQLDQVYKGIDRFTPAVQKGVVLVPETKESYEKAQEDARQVMANRAPKLGDDIVVTPLGTGSSLPTRYRNVSSTLIQIPGKGSLLLDAGEGTWGQLTRLFGDDLGYSSGAWEVLRGLKCVFLSHVHGDHHIGVPKLLAMRRKLNPPPTEPLYVIGTRSIILYLWEYHQIEDLGLDNEDGTGVLTILSDAITSRRSGYIRPSAEPWMDFRGSRSSHEEMCHSLGLHDLIAVPVQHRTRCFGAVLQHTDGWSITFSADTMPADALVEEGMESTLLIHEATMEDVDIELATKKAHSTVGQALDVGQRMKAENILLTHFSARYPKVPNHTTASEDDAIIALAFDLCRIRIGEMAKLRAYLPAIKQASDEVAEEDDDGVDEAHTVW